MRSRCSAVSPPGCSRARRRCRRSARRRPRASSDMITATPQGMSATGVSPGAVPEWILSPGAASCPDVPPPGCSSGSLPFHPHPLLPHILPIPSTPESPPRCPLLSPHPPTQVTPSLVPPRPRDPRGGPHSLSFLMPTSRHFWRRHAWHCRRLALVTGQLRAKGQVKWTPLLMDLLGGQGTRGQGWHRAPRGAGRAQEPPAGATSPWGHRHRRVLEKPGGSSTGGEHPTSVPSCPTPSPAVPSCPICPHAP